MWRVVTANPKLTRLKITVEFPINVVNNPHNMVKIPRKIFLALAWSDIVPITGEMISVVNSFELI